MDVNSYFLLYRYESNVKSKLENLTINHMKLLNGLAKCYSKFKG